VIRHGARTSGAVALTFDDGPGPLTAELLDGLDALGAPATLFVSGAAIAGREDILRRAHAEGHELANHGFAHDSLRHHPLAAARALRRTNRLLRSVTGARPALFRPPYGHHDAALRALAAMAGLRTVLWDVDPRDWERAGDDAQGIEDEALRTARGGSIVLLHDAASERSGDRRATLAALPAIVSGLRDRGLELVTVSRLLALGEP
jgi:peptidoglycan/xylan/chitin deacetylase (PgdA/CDA1 family)